MNRYEQLCASYSQNMKDFKSYKQECHNFAVQLRDATIDYFSIPPQRLRFRSKQDTKILTDDIYEAMEMQKDTFWHVPFAINLQCKKEEFPDENITFEACIRKTINNTFILKLPKETEFVISNKDGKYNFQEFLDFLFIFLKSFYESELDRFLTSGHLPKGQAPIGFRFDPLEK